MLLFKKKFLAAIREGTKTQTVRLWKHRRMRAGQRSYIPGAGYIQVLSVEAVALEDLTDDDAVRDGFESSDALRSEIASLYPEQLQAGHQAYRVVFELLPAEEGERLRAARRQRRAEASAAAEESAKLTPRPIKAVACHESPG